MIFVRRQVLACLKYNILFRARHVPGVKNVLADSLSRLHAGCEVQTASSGGCTTVTNSHTSSTVTTELANITSKLLRSSLQPSSIPTYRRAWNLYSQFSSVVFHTAYSVQLPLSPSNLGLFIAYIVKLVDSSGSITGLKITFLDFKHSYNRPNVSITLKRRSDICPVQSLLDYFSRRGLSNGPLFPTYDGHAVSRKLFTDYLALIFRICGLDPTKYQGHRFRIGAATFAAECGFSDAQIRSMGRWKSDAFRKYIQCPGLCSTA